MRRNHKLYESPGSTLLWLSRCSFALLLLAVAAGCRKEEIEVYRIPKEVAPTMMATGDMDQPHPNVEWDTPPGWEKQPPKPMRIGSFLAKDKDGGTADISVSFFGGDAGGVLANVNRWRKQVSLAEVTKNDLDSLTTAVDVEGGKAMLFDMSGTDPQNGKKTRMVAAMVARADGMWVYKMLGDEQTVAQQKEAFVNFVKTARYPNG